MPGSWNIDGEYFLELTFRSWFEFPFVDMELGIGYNRRSPAVCQASWERKWIVENRNSADYMDMRRIVKARRRQTFLQNIFCDLNLRPYSLWAKWWMPWLEARLSARCIWWFGELKRVCSLVSWMFCIGCESNSYPSGSKEGEWETRAPTMKYMMLPSAGEIGVKPRNTPGANYLECFFLRLPLFFPHALINILILW